MKCKAFPSLLAISDFLLSSVALFCREVPTPLKTEMYLTLHTLHSIYKGADKSLARTGRKQADVSVRMA